MSGLPSNFPLSNPMESWGVWIFAICIGVVYAIRSYCGGPENRSGKRLKGQVAIVTGVSEGSIGEQVAIDLAQRNAKVIISGRSADHSHLEATIRKRSANEDVHFIAMDLLSFKSIKAFVSEFSSANEKLNILINCAGVMMPPFALSDDGFESQFQINFLGQHLLTELLLPLLKKTAASCPEKETRVVNVACRVFSLAEVLDLSSVRGDAAVGSGLNPGECYMRSKAAFAMASLESSRRLKDTGVTVNLVHPGVVNSNHGRHLALSKNILFKFTFYPFFWLLTKSSWHGSQTVLFCAVAEACKGLTGQYFVDLFATKLEGIVTDEEAAKKLLDVASDWIAEREKNE